MKVTILGCGTSTGVPVIGCRCSVCTSEEPKNRRTRTSALFQAGGHSILVDTSTDLRAQCLTNQIERIDAVLFTHPHADHIHGIDELRIFNILQRSAIPCYGNEETIERIKTMFNYIFSEDLNSQWNWKPQLTLHRIEEPQKVFDIRVVPVKIRHGRLTILGYRIEDVAYLTDCSGVPQESMELLKGIRLLIVGALREKPHPTHFTIQQAIELSERLKPERTILTHLSHSIDYDTLSRELPKGIEPAYDGMTLHI